MGTGGVTNPSRPGKEGVFGNTVEAIRRGPFAITRGEANRGVIFRQLGDCCPCPPGQGPGGQAPSPLGQPQRPQKPFQQLGQDPCSTVQDQLMRLGINPQALADCLRGVRQPRRRMTRITRVRRRRRRARAAAPMARMRRRAAAPAPARRRRRRSTARAAVPSRAPRRQRGRYQLLQNGACYDPRTRRFVRRVLCR